MRYIRALINDKCRGAFWSLIVISITPALRVRVHSLIGRGEAPAK